MGRRAVAIFIVVTLLVASLAFALIPLSNNGGKSSPVNYSETGVETYSTPVIEKETIIEKVTESTDLTPQEKTEIIEEIESKTVEEIVEEIVEEEVSAEETYVSKDGKLYAYLSGTAELPVVTVIGNTHSAELATLNLPTMDGYFEWIEKNVTDGINLNGDINIGCSAFEVITSGGHFVGRNQDYAGSSRYPMVFKCIPDNGYRSIGLTYKAMLFDNDATMEEMIASPLLAAAPLAALDGINEKGVTCSILTSGSGHSFQSMENSIFAAGMLRYILDFADSVESAKKIFTEVGYSSDFYGSSLHLFITDKEGNSVAAECIDGKMYFVDTDYITNHYLAPEGQYLGIGQGSVNRITKMKNMIESEQVVGVDLCRDVLKAVGGRGTTWSIVFDVDNLTLNVWYNYKYDVDPVTYDVNQLMAVKCVEDIIETSDDDEETEG